MCHPEVSGTTRNPKPSSHHLRISQMIEYESTPTIIAVPPWTGVWCCTNHAPIMRPESSLTDNRRKGPTHSLVTGRKMFHRHHAIILDVNFLRRKHGCKYRGRCSPIHVLPHPQAMRAPWHRNDQHDGPRRRGHCVIKRPRAPGLMGAPKAGTPEDKVRQYDCYD